MAKDISKYACAKLFDKIGKKTSMLARFPTAVGEVGTADAERDMPQPIIDHQLALFGKVDPACGAGVIAFYAAQEGRSRAAADLVVSAGSRLWLTTEHSRLEPVGPPGMPQALRLGGGMRVLVAQIQIPASEAITVFDSGKLADRG